MAASSHRVIFMGVGFKKKKLLETPSVRFFGRFQLTWRPPRGARKRFFNMETPLFLNFFVPQLTWRPLYLDRSLIAETLLNKVNHGIMLVSVIYYLCVVKSTNVVLLMMIEGPEHRLAYAFETLTIL